MVATKPGTSIAAISKARAALAAATTLNDVVDIRDKAKAVQAYAKASGEGLTTQNLAAEIRLRAERKAGELLKGMEKAKGKRTDLVTSRHQVEKQTLSDIGISKKQSSRWQQLATVTEDDFDRYIAKCVANHLEVLTKDLAKMAARMPSETGKRRQSRQIAVGEQNMTAEIADLDGMKFGTIYADPPWQYGNQATRASTDNHYDTLRVDELCKWPVSQLASDDAHLHLWTTNAFLPDAFDVISAWGFEYKSCFVWVKPQIGIGNYWRVSHEFLLLGVRGDAKRFREHTLRSWGEFKRGKHSAKPEAIRSMIESASPGPYLELFARKTVSGWHVLGNQIERMLC